MGDRVQLTIFDALAQQAQEPEAIAATPPPVDLKSDEQPDCPGPDSPPPALVRHIQKQREFYQKSINHLIDLNCQRWEAAQAQGTPEAIAAYQKWATVNRWQIQKFLTLQKQTYEEL